MGDLNHIFYRLGIACRWLLSLSPPPGSWPPRSTKLPSLSLPASKGSHRHCWLVAGAQLYICACQLVRLAWPAAVSWGQWRFVCSYV